MSQKEKIDERSFNGFFGLGICTFVLEKPERKTPLGGEFRCHFTLGESMRTGTKLFKGKNFFTLPCCQLEGVM